MCGVTFIEFEHLIGRRCANLAIKIGMSRSGGEVKGRESSVEARYGVGVVVAGDALEFYIYSGVFEE